MTNCNDGCSQVNQNDRNPITNNGPNFCKALEILKNVHMSRTLDPKSLGVFIQRKRNRLTSKNISSHAWHH